MYLSQKQISNIATPIYSKSLSSIFISTYNQMSITKQIYTLHKNNYGKLDYLYFKSIVPSLMATWFNKYDGPIASTGDIILYLNKVFIKDNSILYEYQTTQNIPIAIDSNVYRSSLVIVECDDDDNVVINEKKYSQLLASDYGSIDVWAPQTTEISTTTLRNKNKIPLIQRSMNLRFYDKANEGYSTTIDRASLDTNLSGYSSAMTDLIKKKEALYKRDNREY